MSFRLTLRPVALALSLGLAGLAPSAHALNIVLRDISSTPMTAEQLGAGLQALLEITLDRQGAEHLDAFEARAVQEAAVQQCWRVSPGPDFVLVVQVADMPAYHAFTQRLLTQDANVRNIKAFFSVKRAKFDTRVGLPSP